MQTINPKVQSLTLKTIECKKDIEDFFSGLINNLRVNFNPDEDFSSYIEYHTGKPFFTKKQCKELDKTLNECWEYCDREGLCIYDIAFPILQKAIGSAEEK